MLYGIQITSVRGETLELLLGDVSKGYVVKSIDGLEPVKANLVSSSSANEDGEQYQASRREKRNIVLKLGLEGAFITGGVKKLRSRLYDFVLPKSQIKMRFLSTDMGPLDIYGTVESFDAPLFTQDPEATISILNFDPDFFDPAGVVLSGSSTSTSTRTNVTYNGTIETGFLLRFTAPRSLSSLQVSNIPPDGVERKMDIVVPMIPNDILEISTVTGNKRVTLIRGGVTSSLLYGLSPFSDWINLFPGVNQFYVAIDGAAVPYNLVYTTKYGGL